MRLYGYAFLLLILSACSPTPKAQGLIAPVATQAGAPDYGATLSALSAIQAGVTGTAQAHANETAEARALASAQAQSTVDALLLVQAGATLTAGAAGATNTAEAVGTATSLAWPAVFAARQEIERRNTAADERARVALRLEPYKQGAQVAARYLLLALGGLLLFALIYYIPPAIADRIRGEGIITAYQISEPRHVPQLPAPVGSGSARFVVEGNHGERVAFPLTDEQLFTLAHALYTGTPFAERHFTARAVPNFRAVQDTAIAAGLAAWRNPEEPRQGCVLTAKGEAFFFRQVLGLDVPPSPAEELTFEGVR